MILQLPHMDGHYLEDISMPLEGHLFGTAHSHLLLDTHLYEVEVDDGTVNQYFAYIIAENLYSQVDSESSEFMILKEISNHQ